MAHGRTLGVLLALTAALVLLAAPAMAQQGRQELREAPIQQLAQQEDVSEAGQTVGGQRNFGLWGLLGMVGLVGLVNRGGRGAGGAGAGRSVLAVAALVALLVLGGIALVLFRASDTEPDANLGNGPAGRDVETGITADETVDGRWGLLGLSGLFGLFGYSNNKDGDAAADGRAGGASAQQRP